MLSLNKINEYDIFDATSVKSKSLKILFTISISFYLLASRLAEATFGKIIFAFRLLNLLKAFSV